MNILVLTDIIQAPILTKQKRENDVLFTTAELHEKMQKDVKFTFVFIVPYSNFFLSKFSKFWNEYKTFKDLGKFNYKNRLIEIIPVPTFKGRFKSALFSLAYIINRRKLERIIKENKIDLVHAHNVRLDSGMAYELYKRFKIPYVITSRELGTIKLDGYIKKCLTEAKAVLSLAPTQNKLAKLLNKNAFVVPHGVDSRFLETEKVYIRNSEPVRIVTMCRLLRWKNIDKVLLALEKIQHGFIYDVYGEGPDEQRLQDILSTLSIRSSVNFKGYIPYEKVPETLVNYDLFVMPSYKEKFGRVYIEAMACGLPVIGAKNCGIDDYIEEGVQGFTVNHRDVEELTNVLNKFITNKTLAITLGRNAKTYSKNFPWEVIIKKIDCIYRNAISKQ